MKSAALATNAIVATFIAVREWVGAVVVVVIVLGLIDCLVVSDAPKLASGADDIC